MTRAHRPNAAHDDHVTSHPWDGHGAEDVPGGALVHRGRPGGQEGRLLQPLCKAVGHSLR